MKLINARTLIQGVASAWRSQYPDARLGKDKQEIGLRLAALDGNTATAEQVNAIIGNDSWTTPPTCGECGKRGGVVVQLGEEPDYDSATAHICPGCLQQAVVLLEGGAA